jgi:phospholipid/cholesterol/gamma-HCH transport system substrate-binding protein
MRDVSTEIKVGGVVILGIVILLYAVIWIKGYQFNVEHYQLSGLFPQVGNLDIGDPVAVLGVDKGEVKDIRLEGDQVLVTMSLASDVELKKDAAAAVMNIGLMGERFVAISPGISTEPFDRSQPIAGQYDTGIPEVMGMMGKMITQVQTLLTQLEGTFGEKGKAETIREIIDNLQELTRTTNEFVKSHAKTMETAVDDLSSVAGGMKAFLDSNSTAIDTAMANIAVASQNIKTLSERLNVLTEQISNGEGTLGKAVTDDSLYYDLKRTINNLDSLVTDFKKHPKKYVKVSIF